MIPGTYPVTGVEGGHANDDILGTGIIVGELADVRFTS
jgi:hypothetical protein